MVVSTYQAASGAGQAAMDELELQTKEVLEGKEVTKNIFPFQVLPPTPFDHANQYNRLSGKLYYFGCQPQVFIRPTGCCSKLGNCSGECVGRCKC